MTIKGTIRQCIISELEKIQDELQINADMEWNQQVGASKGLEFAIEIIDDHIDALKGETE